MRHHLDPPPEDPAVIELDPDRHVPDAPHGTLHGFPGRHHPGECDDDHCWWERSGGDEDDQVCPEWVHLLVADDALAEGHRSGTYVAACGELACTDSAPRCDCDHPYCPACVVAAVRWNQQPPGTPSWALRQIVQLADDADGLIDDQLRARLVALAEACAR